jgi:hypothetical protein
VVNSYAGQEGAMGAVVTFRQLRRKRREAPTRVADISAAVIILPVIRIERTHDAPSVTGAETAKSSPSRKRRKRASPP